MTLTLHLESRNFLILPRTLTENWNQSFEIAGSFHDKEPVLIKFVIQISNCPSWQIRCKTEIIVYTSAFRIRTARTAPYSFNCMFVHLSGWLCRKIAKSSWQLSASEMLDLHKIVKFPDLAILTLGFKMRHLVACRCQLNFLASRDPEPVEVRGCFFRGWARKKNYMYWKNRL